MERFELIPVTKIREPRNPVRSGFDEDALMELARSIRDNGLKQPLRVSPLPDGTFEVRVGHRRLLALRMIGALEAKCLVDDEEGSLDAEQIAENADREDVTPVDEARRYKQLFDRLGQDVDQVAELVKRSRARVENRLLLLMGDAQVLAALEEGKINLGVAEQLNGFKDAERRAFHLDWCIRSGANVAQVRDWKNRANAVTEAERLAPAPPAAPVPAPSEAPPGSEYDVPFAAYAQPEQFSSSLEPRRCPFCGETHPEYQMFRVFVCQKDAQHYLKPLARRGAGG